MRTDIQSRPYPYRIVAIGLKGWQVQHNNGYCSPLFDTPHEAQRLAEYLYDTGGQSC